MRTTSLITIERNRKISRIITGHYQNIITGGKNLEELSTFTFIGINVKMASRHREIIK